MRPISTVKSSSSGSRDTNIVLRSGPKWITSTLKKTDHSNIDLNINQLTSTYASETWILTKRDSNQINIFEWKVYRRILGKVFDSGKENWRILTNKWFYAMVKKPTITETIRLNKLHWFGRVRRTVENRIPKKVLYMNLETKRLRRRPRNRLQDEVREDGRLVGGKGWKERVYNTEKWKKLMRTARNWRILHMPMEWMNEWILIQVLLHNQISFKMTLYNWMNRHFLNQDTAGQQEILSSSCV